MSTPLEDNSLDHVAVPIGGAVPVGTVLMYAGVMNAATIIKLGGLGWLPCDGTELKIQDYPDLFDVIGGSHGQVGAFFRVPDLRGRFVRGVDANAKRDPDATARQAPAQGGNTGDQVGSTQGDAFKKHSHTVSNLPEGLHWAVNELEVYHVAKWNGQSRQSSEVGGNETRPLNVALNFIIRYRKGD